MTIIRLLCFTIIFASFLFSGLFFIEGDNLCAKHIEVISKSLIGRKSLEVKEKETLLI